MTYSQYRAYSAIHDAVMVRLSVAGPDGGEFYMLLPHDDGRRWRERRADSLELIQMAIDQGCEPGEVRVSPSQEAA